MADTKPHKHSNGIHKVVKEEDFEAPKHFYPRTMNATCHPTVAHFLSLSNKRIAERYCHMHPQVDFDRLLECLSYVPKYMRWSGADLFPCTTADGRRAMVVVETNTCPSGQKSMPSLDENVEYGSYEAYITRCFIPVAEEAKAEVPGGKLAVVFDKNEVEASGYAAAMADFAKEEVILCEYHADDPIPNVRFKDGVMEIANPNKKDEFVPIRAAVRYVTQKPWTCIPLNLKTRLLNPIASCLAGGRNKMIAAKAYEFFNSELEDSGLAILSPRTIRDVRLAEIPMWVASLGGKAVVKIPYSNAGQGVYTITCDAELQAFMEECIASEGFIYDSFIVQALVGNHKWSSEYYHIGTVPDKAMRSFVADLRFMIIGTNNGFRPIAMYSRRAAIPLAKDLTPGQTSWDMLGTNLSFKKDDGTWSTDTNRLLLVDRKDFNMLGCGLDDLISAYIQTCLSTIAIDKIAIQLCPSDGGFNMDLFMSLNNDQALVDEILSCEKRANVINTPVDPPHDTFQAAGVAVITEILEEEAATPAEEATA
jgi:hypothetical protein